MMNRFPHCSWLVLLFFSIVSCSSPESGVVVTVKNPSQFDRGSQTIEVKMADLLVFEPRLRDEKLGVTDRGTGRALAAQVTGEELLFQSDFAAGETRTFLIAATERPAAETQQLVDGYFALPREDYAWENDRIAFRVYGPALAADVGNGVDVWTKRVRSLIVRKWYEGDAQSGTGGYYHTDRGEGADFFAVGRTLGAGGSGIWHGDSLYQPGVFSSVRTLSNGPIRTAFELQYTGWDIGGKKITEVKQISLDAGQNLNEVVVVFTGGTPGDTLLVACGLVKRTGVQVSLETNKRWLAMWGPTNDDTTNGMLGTGVVVPVHAFVRMQESGEQVMLLGRAVTGEPFRYWAGAGWSRSGDFADVESWERYLDAFSVARAEPLTITLHQAEL